MPNKYTLKINTENTPPIAILVNEAGVAVASKEILASSTEPETRAWAEAAAEKYEAELTRKQAEEAAAASATSKAETLKTALEGTEITV